jgi:hypothetical protein
MARIPGAYRFALDLNARVRLKFNLAGRPLNLW